MVNGRVVHLWMYFDSALLQVHDIDKETLEFKDLDYVSFYTNSSHSRHLLVGMELFFIGLPRQRVFHIIRRYCHMSLSMILLIILTLLTM
jgi:hypothetical protein